MATFFTDAKGADPAIRRLAFDAVESAFRSEARGTTTVPTRLNVQTPKGFLRIMPGLLDDVMGLKVMTLVEDVGTRYLVLLYAVDTGELLALFDADELTRIRTGATTAVAARALVPGPLVRLGMLGTGFEAVGQLRAMADLWQLRETLVYSPNTERCKRFATSMSAELGIEVRAVSSVDEALEEQAVVLLATKSTLPVIDGARLARGTIVLSIGSTRPDLRELDRATLSRVGILVADDAKQVLVESGDIADGLREGVLTPDRIVSLASLIQEPSILRRDDQRDLVVFKSVGTVLQDLALAAELYRRAGSNGLGIDLGELSRLKPFAAGRPNGEGDGR